MYNGAECNNAKMSMPFLRIVLIFLVLSGCAGAVQARHTVESPDGNVILALDVGDERGDLIYSVAFDGRPIIIDSRLGLALKDAASLDTGFS